MSGSAAPVTLSLNDEVDTARLGRAIAHALEPGMLVLLEGGLGAGKTALARVIVRTLVEDAGIDVPSPSFALVQPYERPDGAPVLHADLYRLAAAGETRELGLFDDPDAIVLVEWPDRDPALAAEADLSVALTQGEAETARIVALYSPRGSVDCTTLVADL